MKKINIAVLSLALLALVSTPAFAQSPVHSATSTTNKVRTQVVSAAVKQANLNYAAAIKKANADYNAAVKTARQAYSANIKTAKTKAERVALLKTEKTAITTARTARTATHSAALTTLKAAKAAASK